MKESRPLEVVFLANFTDYSYRSIPAIAQLADTFAIRLTIVHTVGDSNPRLAEARAQLSSFFPEADHYAESRRLVVSGDPVEAIEMLQSRQKVDLLIAPASDPLGLPRIGHRSLRTRLLRDCKVPVWTIGRCTTMARLRMAPKHVGCWIDFDMDGWDRHLSFAREFAWKSGADLHILHALPEVSEGSLLRPDLPLCKEGIVEEVTRHLDWSPVPLHFHVADSDRKSARKKLMDESGIDLVFAADQDSGWLSWLSSKPRLLDECACPSIHIPIDTCVPVWNLTPQREWAATKVEPMSWRAGSLAPVYSVV